MAPGLAVKDVAVQLPPQRASKPADSIDWVTRAGLRRPAKMSAFGEGDREWSLGWVIDPMVCRLTPRLYA